MVARQFKIEPDVPGDLVWRDDKTVAFLPASALAPGTSYTVTLGAGARSVSGYPLKRGQIWRFRTRDPQLLYLGRERPGADVRQLFVVALDGDTPRQLTDEAQGVWDYAVHPQGETIVYSLLRQDGGTDLWRMDRDGSNQRLLLACPEAACLAPAWSPDGRQLAYERRDIRADGPNLEPMAARIWLFDLEKGQERPLFDYDVALHSPVWSPLGERLAYVSPILPGIEAFDLQTDELTQFGNEWGATPAWSPDGKHLVVADLAFAGEALIVRLLRLDLESEQGQDISDTEGFVQDVSPAWSPDGNWIAFGRQFQDKERWTPGRQLWLVRPDGSEAYPLLSKPMMDSFAFSWRPDGAALAYLQTDLSEGPQPVPDVSVWVYGFEQGESAFVASDAVLPKWLP